MRLRHRLFIIAVMMYAINAWAQDGATTTPQDSAVAATPQETPLDSTQTLTPKLTELFTKLRTDSNNAALLYDIYKEYLKIGRRNYAVEFINASLRKDPTNMDVLYEKGELLLEMGKKKSAYEAFLLVMRDFKGQAYLDRIGPKFVSNFKITQITNNKFNDVMASYAPDGKSIIFQSDRSGNWDIFTMNPDQGESSVKKLTDDLEADENPAYSTDGKWIAFASTRDDKSTKEYKSRELYFMDKTGKRVTRLTSSYGGDNWSPIFLDTVTIAFSSDRSDFSSTPFAKKNTGIYTIERNGSFLFKMFYQDKMNYTDVAYKAVSNQFVFAQRADDSDFDLYMTSTDTKEKPINLTNHPKNDLQPSVSKNGNFITFVSDRDGNYEVYRMQADGRDQTRITNDDGDDVYPKFSPDGNKIIFSSNRNGKYQLYIASTEESSAVTVQSVIAILEKRIASSSDN
ncbi:hypothetical protein L6Q79_14060 [bacterium]|nr:hypothetical protein [bacterium]NUN45909.1 PD40 domain-containing protein [bacterium]